MEPRGQQLTLPEAYGRPTRVLEWVDVRLRLERSPHYWLVTVRPDGRPHVVPVDGLWNDDACYFGGDPTTVHMRNLAINATVALHLEDATAAVIVEGRADHIRPSSSAARQLAAASKKKYGYAPPAKAYLEAGVWRVRPRKVLAWTVLYEDATRFSFSGQ